MTSKEVILDILGQIPTSPLLFVGSGMSRRYLGLEDWRGLLSKFCSETGREFEFYFSKSDGNMPGAASLLATDFNEIWWNSKKYEESRNQNKSLIIGRSSALKI